MRVTSGGRAPTAPLRNGEAGDRFLLGHRAGYRGKRALDLALLSLSAGPALLIGMACVVAVKVSSRGPALFRQLRVGEGGRPFIIYKLRTMKEGTNPVLPASDRITLLGRLLRRLSLDELPQLINVARAEMSFVGPRPTLGYQVERYSAWQRRRLDARPGITGLAQVDGRNGLVWAERIELDVWYVDNQSAWLDCKLLARTFLQLVRGCGVEGHPVDDPIAEL